MTTGNDHVILEKLRTDLAFQLKTADELDWDYFLETALKAKFSADSDNINMVECEHSLEEIITDAKASIL